MASHKLLAGHVTFGFAGLTFGRRFGFFFIRPGDPGQGPFFPAHN